MKWIFIILIIPILDIYADDNHTRWETLEGCRLIHTGFFDGDTFLVQHQQREVSFRIYWVDAPDCKNTPGQSIRGQSQYFNIPESQITMIGDQAKNFTKSFLKGEFKVHTRWEDARTSNSPCYFGIIEKENTTLSMALIKNGLGRIYGIPTTSPWPGGFTAGQYLKQLKNQERTAQKEGTGIWSLATGSLQIAGLETLSAGGGDVLVPVTPSEQVVANRINVNTATLEELDTLPGIGPALSRRIINARPIATIDALVQIPGISANTLAQFRHRIATEDPSPPEKTIAFYLADLDRYLEQEVVVVVQNVQAMQIESPDGFRALNLNTGFGGRNGGAVTAYIPEEFFDSFTQHYATPGKEFTALLHSQNGEIVLVYRRK